MAASDKEVTINVEGARELRRAIKKMEAKDLDDALKKANKAAAEVVAARAKQAGRTPVKSGDLQKSVKALGSKATGRVKAGSAKGGTKDYAGVVHYGDPNRGRKPQPFLHEAMSDEWDRVYEAYEKNINKIADDLSSRGT